MSLTKSFPPEQYASVLESWQWIDLEAKTPVCASLFGDVFLKGNDGYWFLDVLAGTLERRWADESALESDLASEEGRGQYLLAFLVADAEHAGMTLSSDEVYDFTQPP